MLLLKTGPSTARIYNTGEYGKSQSPVLLIPGKKPSSEPSHSFLGGDFTRRRVPVFVSATHRALDEAVAAVGMLLSPQNYQAEQLLIAPRLVQVDQTE